MIGNMEQDKPNIWINVKMTTSQLLHQTHDEKKKVIPLKEQILEEYHEFLDVFDEKKADRFPEERVLDHKIKLKDGFVPKSFKNYNLTPIEQIKLDKFLKENLERVISDHHNLLWCHLSFLSIKKKQENYDHAKIIDI